MILADVNVLVYAHREDAPRHAAYRQWLEDLVNGDQAYGVSDRVLSGFLRVVTHPRVFDPPSHLPDGLAFAQLLRTTTCYTPAAYFCRPIATQSRSMPPDRRPNPLETSRLLTSTPFPRTLELCLCHPIGPIMSPRAQRAGRRRPANLSGLH